MQLPSRSRMMMCLVGLLPSWREIHRGRLSEAINMREIVRELGQLPVRLASVG
jgi:hypothetical protein